MKNKNISLTVNSKLCCSCGLCSNYCPKDAISYRIDSLGFYKPIVNSDNCIGCGQCLRACPGINDLKNYNNNREEFYYGYSRDDEMHINASSGGLATELLCYLISKKYVDYVTCVSNRTSEKLPEQILTNDINVIRGSRTSKYCPIQWNDIISQIDNINGTVAVIAMPCQINSIKKHYANRKHKIKYFISLLCNHTPSLYATDYLVKAIDKKASLKSIIYRGEGFPGFMKLSLTTGSDLNHREYKLPYRQTWAAGYGLYFKNRRCTICNDPFAKNADIVVGDSYFLQDTDKLGATFCIIRNREIELILKKMKDECIIDLFDGPNENIRKRYYQVLYDKENNFQRKNSLLSVMGRSILSPVKSNKFVHSFSEIRFFYQDLFFQSIGKYHFLWNYLARKNNVIGLIKKSKQ